MASRREKFLITAIILLLSGFIYQNYKNGEFLKIYSKIFNKNKDKNFIYVGITGAVLRPRVYKVKKGTRIKTLIKIAGGYRKDALRDILNEDYVLKDREVIFVPFKTKKKIKGIGFGIAPEKQYLIKPLKLIEED